MCDIIYFNLHIYIYTYREREIVSRSLHTLDCSKLLVFLAAQAEIPRICEDEATTGLEDCGNLGLVLAS